MLEARAHGFEDVLPTNDLSETKVGLFKSIHTWRLMTDCMVMCNNGPFNHQQTADMLNALTGWSTTPIGLMKYGERANNLMRAFNVREGFTPRDDVLPPRSFEPTLKGALKNQAQDPATLERAKRDFYTLSGWDPETGIPTRAKLGELGISWVAEELARQGKIPG